MQLRTIGSINSQYYYKSWMEALKLMKKRKVLIHKYNGKQVLMEVLRRLNMDECFINNDVLLNYLVSHFSELLEKTSIKFLGITDRYDLEEKMFSLLEAEYEESVQEYLEYFKKRFVVIENDQSIAILKIDWEEVGNQKGTNSFKSLFLLIKKRILNYYFLPHQFQVLGVSFNKQTKQTTNFDAHYELSFKNNLWRVHSGMTRETYDELFRMVVDETVHFDSVNFDIESLDSILDAIYTEKITLSYNLKQQNGINYSFNDGKNKSFYEIEWDNIYDKVVFNFIDWYQIVRDNDIYTQLNLEPLFLEQVEFYKSKNISEFDYIFDKSEQDEYCSVVYDFSKKVLETVTDNEMKLQKGR